MKQSSLFVKTLKNLSSEEKSKNANLLTRGGFIYKNSSGVYTYLPLGLRVIKKISSIIQEEMNAIGAVEVLMPALVENKYLEITGRLGVDVGFDVSYKNDKKPSYVLGWTHEEVITDIASKNISSWRDLPFYAYQIQTKFRAEPRAKSGLSRGREFLMKDLYSFHKDEEDLLDYYDKVKGAYEKVFERCGLDAVYTLAAGGDFTASYTHEFQVVAEAGEDTIYYCEKSCGLAFNEEVMEDKKDACDMCGGALSSARSVEVGNIFQLGTKYSEAFGLSWQDENGNKKPVFMGSYGIGVSRVMATIVEVLSDEKGIIWSENVAPFSVHIIAISNSDKVMSEATRLYERLVGMGVEVLFDDRDIRAGEKLVQADLIGLPNRVVVSDKSVEKQVFGFKKRNEEAEEMVSFDKLSDILK